MKQRTPEEGLPHPTMREVRAKREKVLRERSNRIIDENKEDKKHPVPQSR